MESGQNNTANMMTGTHQQQQQQKQQQPEHVPTVAQSSATGPPNIPAAAITITSTAPVVSRISVPSIAAEKKMATADRSSPTSAGSGTRKRSAPSSTTDLHDVSSAEAGELLSSTSNISNSKPQQSNGGATISRVGKDGEPLSEKKLRRLEKNRLSARECRRRKREATENMQGQINLLEGENLRLRLQLQVR
jgi:hypothetical protein